MKKNFITTVIVVGVLCVCCVVFGNLTKNDRFSKENPTGIVTKHFEYKDHKYIKFIESNELTIVHDPDCPCLYSEVPFRGEPSNEY